MKETCFHCGLAIPAHIELTIHHRQQTRHACCVGCQMVAQSIIDAGLDHYYNQRTKEAVKAELPPKEILAQIQLYDLDEVQENFVTTKEDNKKEAVLMLEGITCAACVWLIEQQLLRLNGVISVDINFSTHRARVAWDDQQLRLSAILEKITRTGYFARPFDASRFEENTQKERKKALTQLWVAGLSMMQVMMYAIPVYLAPDGEIETPFLWLLHWTSFVLTLPVMLYSAIPFYHGAIRDLKNKRVGMDTPVTLAIIAAFLGSFYALLTHNKAGVFFDSISMFVFLLLGGRYLEALARRKAGDASERLVKLIPAFCHKLEHYPEHQQTQESLVARIQTDDVVLIKAGEVICVDGIVLSGHSDVNEAMLTGESLPINKIPDSTVTAGTLNIDSPIIVKARRVGQNTRLNAIVRLLDKALSQKPKLAELADRFASWFVALLLIIATITFVAWFMLTDFQNALWITISLLVISCPCALSLATPTALAAATGNLAKKGLLISSPHALETLDKVTDIVFDKTGTLTEGKMTLTQTWVNAGQNKQEILTIAALLENQSNHPIAFAFKNTDTPQDSVLDQEHTVGQGIGAMINKQKWRIGRCVFVAQLAGAPPAELSLWQKKITQQQTGSTIFLGNSSGFQAAFYLTDSIKQKAYDCIRWFHDTGIQIHLLSGDGQKTVEQTAQTLSIRHFAYEVSPENKLSYIEERQAQGKIVLMVGDGINDVPVLAKANVSIAIGTGADIAREGADMVLLNDDLTILPQACLLARKTKKIIKENLLWASCYNIIAIPLAIGGQVTPEIAALGMALSSLLVVSNALRLLK